MLWIDEIFTKREIVVSSQKFKSALHVEFYWFNVISFQIKFSNCLQEMAGGI